MRRHFRWSQVCGPCSGQRSTTPANSARGSRANTGPAKPRKPRPRRSRIGKNVTIRDTVSIRPAFVVPLSTGDNRNFRYEAGLQVNVRY